MQTKGIRLRWLYETCYEIVLPNGTVVLTDPDLTIHDLKVTARDLQRVDYILCTHTHYDHTSDIGYLTDRFGCKLLVGQLSAQDLCRCFNLPYNSVYVVAPGDVFEFPDVTFHFFRGKHTAIPSDPVRGRPASTLMTTSKRWGLEGHGPADQFGWIEFFDFLMVAPNNQTLMMCGGIPAFRKSEEMAKLHHPDILIRQSGGFGSLEEYADYLDRIGPQVAFPSHHEHAEKKFGMPLDQIESEVNRHLADRNSPTVFVNPEQYRWYELALSVQPL